MAKDLLIGIDLGGTNIKIGTFDQDLKHLAKTSVATAVDMGPQAVVDRMAVAIRDLVKKAGVKTIAAAGIGTPGPADYQKGVIFKSANMPTFTNAPIRQMVSDKLGCPVAFDNDANVACYGELKVGAGKDVQDMVFFTLGTGIGCGIVAHGRLIQGATGNAAEAGHMIIYPGGELCNCGQRGCAEAHASASHTARRATEAVRRGEPSSLRQVLDSQGQITSRDVYEHLAKGDALAKKITDETAEALAILCVNMLHVTDPARIVLAGGMIAAGDLLLGRIRHFFSMHLWKMKTESVEIVFASLGEDAGIFGAAAIAKDLLN